MLYFEYEFVTKVPTDHKWELFQIMALQQTRDSPSHGPIVTLCIEAYMHHEALMTSNQNKDI